MKLTEYRGVPLIDLRSYYPDTVTGEFMPGKGISLRRDLLPELKKAINAADKAMKEGGA